MSAGAGRGGRLVGIDLARWVALIGMIAVHTLPSRDPDGTLTLAEHAFAGRSSALFAVLLGVSLALMTGGPERHRGARLRGDAAGIAVRAVLVGAIGLALGRVESGIAVILPSYAVLMLLACAFLAVPWRALLVAAATWCVAAPLVSFVVRGSGTLPLASRVNPTFSTLEEPSRLLSELALTGYYPAVVWLAYALLGLAIGRMPLRRTATAASLALLGSAVAVAAVVASSLAAPAVGLSEGEVARSATAFSGTTAPTRPDLLVLDAPHSGTPFDLLTTCGSAAAVIGLALLLVAALRRLRTPGPGLDRVLAVAAGGGTATLSLYSLHVCLRGPDLIDGEGGSTFLAHVLIVSALGAGLVLAGRRGPLEAVSATAADAARRTLGTSPART